MIVYKVAFNFRPFKKNSFLNNLVVFILASTFGCNSMQGTDRQNRKLLLNGVFAVNKVKHWTSVEVLEKIKAVLIAELRPHQRPKLLKVGHGGTLDKTVTGVLVVGVCQGCKLLTKLLHGDKKYIVEARLGVATDTYNETGDITRKASYDHISREGLEETLAAHFVGNILQTPPVYSALKRDGVRLADRARSGEEVRVEPRPVTCHSVHCTHFSPPYFTLQVHCGSGFYIRSLVHQLGLKLGSCAHVIWLHRTQHGPFTERDMLSVDRWTAAHILDAIRASRDTHHALLRQETSQLR